MPDTDLPILPSTKVGALLDRYPELEEILIGLAPPFKKLKNPILRKGVGKVASLQQVAAVGGLSVRDLVNKLRITVGQDVIAPAGLNRATTYFSEQPNWFDASKIVTRIDERDCNPDEMPIATVLQKVSKSAIWRNTGADHNVPSCSRNRHYETKGIPSVVRGGAARIDSDLCVVPSAV
jgi:hypothetical protein